MKANTEFTIINNEALLKLFTGKGITKADQTFFSMVRV